MVVSSVVSAMRVVNVVGDVDVAGRSRPCSRRCTLFFSSFASFVGLLIVVAALRWLEQVPLAAVLCVPKLGPLVLAFVSIVLAQEAKSLVYPLCLTGLRRVQCMHTRAAACRDASTARRSRFLVVTSHLCLAKALQERGLVSRGAGDGEHIAQVSRHALTRRGQTSAGTAGNEHALQEAFCAVVAGLQRPMARQRCAERCQTRV